MPEPVTQPPTRPIGPVNPESNSPPALTEPPVTQDAVASVVPPPPPEQLRPPTPFILPEQRQTPPTSATSPVAPKSTPTPPTGRRRWLLWLMIGVILFLILGIFWWFGLGFGPPQRAETAARKAQQAIDGQQSYAVNVSGTLGLEINRLPRPTGNTITEGFADGPIRYRFPVDLTGSRANQDQTEFSGTIDLSDASAALSGVLPSSATLAARYIEGVSYLKAPLFALIFEDVASSAWIETELLARPVNPPGSTLLPNTTIQRSHRIGIEQLGPRLTAHYRYEADRIDDALRLIGLHLPDGIGGSDEAVIELWIDVWSHLPYQLLIKGELGFTDYQLDVDLTAQLYAFGEGETMTAPLATDIIELTPAMLDLDAISSQLALRARDHQRKTDLIEIHQALKRYKNDHGSYPSTIGVVQKTNDPATVLTTLVTEGYLATLAHDPKDPDFWYGYLSNDGVSYELWSVLEYLRDVDGEVRGDYVLYVLTPESVVPQAVEDPTGDETPGSSEETLLPTEDPSVNDPADAPRLPVK